MLKWYASVSKRGKLPFQTFGGGDKFPSLSKEGNKLRAVKGCQCAQEKLALLKVNMSVLGEPFLQAQQVNNSSHEKVAIVWHSADIFQSVCQKSCGSDNI